MSRRGATHPLLRAALPPGVSVAIHAALLAVLVALGSRLVAPAPEPARPVALAEIERPPAPAPRAALAPRRDPGASAPDGAGAPPAPAAPARAGALERAVAHAAAPPERVTLDALGTLDAPGGADLLSPATRAQAVRFAGARTGAAARLVFCVDASGATATSFSYIRERLLQSIDTLSPTQRFRVVLFRERSGSGVELVPRAREPLVRATRANKELVARTLGRTIAAGRSNPLEALRAALALEPDLVILVSRAIERTGDDPWAGGLAKVRASLDTLNPPDPVTGTRPVVIKTIQLLDDDPSGVLRAIGTWHGDGVDDHQVVPYEDLVDPEEPEPTHAGGTRDQRLARVRGVLKPLAASGSLDRAFMGAPAPSEIDALRDAAARARAALGEHPDPAPGPAMAHLRIALIEHAIGASPGPIDTDALRAHVFMDPDTDARRRTLIAQNDASKGDRRGAIDALRAVLDERDELGLSGAVVARTLVALEALGDTHPDAPAIERSAPFVGGGATAWRSLLAWARAVGAARTATDAVYAPLAPLLQEANPGAEGMVLALRSWLERSGLDAEARDPRVRLVLARDALRDPRRRRGAVGELLDLGERGPPAVAPDALWLACVGAGADGEHDTLARAASTLVGRYPDHEHAEDALLGALARVRPDHPGREPLLRTALDRLGDRAESDLWRLELARRLDTPERLALIEALTPGTRESDLGAELYDEIARARTPSDDRARLDQARRVHAVLDRLGSPIARDWSIRAAHLEASLEPASAVGRLDALLSEGDDPGLSFLLARALIRVGDPARASRELLRVAERSTPEEDAYWRAWTLLIETAARVGDERTRAAARAHLTRLSLVDPSLGPEPYASRLAAARRTLHSDP